MKKTETNYQYGHCEKCRKQEHKTRALTKDRVCPHCGWQRADYKKDGGEARYS